MVEQEVVCLRLEQVLIAASGLMVEIWFWALENQLVAETWFLCLKQLDMSQSIDTSSGLHILQAILVGAILFSSGQMDRVLTEHTIEESQLIT